jgi:hypothetical protein
MEARDVLWFSFVVLLGCGPGIGADSGDNKDATADVDPTEFPQGYCDGIRSRIEQRRDPKQALSIADWLAASRMQSPRRPIPLRLLVEQYRPADGQGRPLDMAGRQRIDELTLLVLCDDPTREVITLQFLANHPEYRQ